MVKKVGVKCVHIAEVVGSNPTPPTNTFKDLAEIRTVVFSPLEPAGR
jgi:hypothetical protein